MDMRQVTLQVRWQKGCSRKHWMYLHGQNGWSKKGVVLISPWTNHPLSQLVQWCGMIDAALPIRWACPGTPAPAPTGPLHTGQSDSHPGVTYILKLILEMYYHVLDISYQFSDIS